MVDQDVALGIGFRPASGSPDHRFMWIGKSPIKTEVETSTLE